MTSSSHPYSSMSTTLGGNSSSRQHAAAAAHAATAAAAQAEEEQEISNYHEWDAQRLGLFIRKKGLGDYQDVLIQHRISGQLAPLLSDDDLKDMGISIVGDRLMFKHVIQQLSRRERFHKRIISSLWDGEEQVFFSPAEQSCMTLGGFCPIDPSTYKLTTSHLRVKKVQPCRCGPIRLTCCFGASYVSNNIDLSKVDDVDVIGVPAPCLLRVCCCASGKDLVEVESRFMADKSSGNGGKVFLQLPEGHGEAVAQLILNQIEEQQKMDRGV